MKIGSLQDEMQAMMLDASNATRQVTGKRSRCGLQCNVAKAVNNVNGLQKASSDLAVRFDRGDEGVSLSDVMIARNKSSVAFDATIQVRNKLVDAYKALMNMPV